MHPHSFAHSLSGLLALVVVTTAAPGVISGFPGLGGDGGWGGPAYPTTAFPTTCYTSILTTAPFGRPTTGWWTVTSTSCTLTCTATSTVTPTTTSTVTTDTTVTSTADTSTSTAIVTDISTVTDVSITTETTTVTSTISTVSTSVVPTSVAFLPVDTSVPGASYDRSVAPVKRWGFNAGVSVNATSNAAWPNRVYNYVPGVGPSGSPGNVVCYQYQSKCSTTTTTVTSTASTSTVVTTSTSTSTFTTTPGATTTSTITDTVTSASISTEFATTTTVATVYTSTTTTYAACATNNRAHYVAGNAINGFFSNGDALGSGATNEYDCCVSALVNPIGALWGFFVRSSTCLIVTAPGGTCSAGQASDGTDNVITTSANPAAAVSCVLGNANCGLWDTVTVGN